MYLHSGRTPEEVWAGTTLPKPASVLARDATNPAVNVVRIHFKGDYHLPTLSIQYLDSA